MAESKNTSPDEEIEFSTSTAIMPKSNSDLTKDTLKELEFGGSSIYAFMRFPQVWKSWVKWRHDEEEGLNLYQLKENQKFDELVSRIFKDKTITDDLKLFDYLLRTYQDSGARKTMRRIKVVTKAFKDEYKAKNSQAKKS